MPCPQTPNAVCDTDLQDARLAEIIPFPEAITIPEPLIIYGGFNSVEIIWPTPGPGDGDTLCFTYRKYFDSLELSQDVESNMSPDTPGRMADRVYVPMADKKYTVAVLEPNELYQFVFWAINGDTQRSEGKHYWAIVSPDWDSEKVYVAHNELRIWHQEEYIFFDQA